MNVRRNLAAGAAATALTLSLAACGGDEEAGGSSGTTQAVTPSTSSAASGSSSGTADGRVAQSPDSGPATRAEELATVQVQNTLDGVSMGGWLSDEDVLHGGRTICATLDLDPDYLSEAIMKFHDPDSAHPSAMIPPTLVREFCPSHYPDKESLGEMFRSAWGSDTWYPGQN
ncbi:MAG: hypothetical protein L0K27_02605 [Corynebacterium nuruki]|nr:hypothetical protein [Corynebacterium nuruki]